MAATVVHSSAGIDRILSDPMLRSTVSFIPTGNLTAFITVFKAQQGILLHLVQVCFGGEKNEQTERIQYGEMTIAPASKPLLSQVRPSSKGTTYALILFCHRHLDEQ